MTLAVEWLVSMVSGSDWECKRAGRIWKRLFCRTLKLKASQKLFRILTSVLWSQLTNSWPQISEFLVPTYISSWDSPPFLPPHSPDCPWNCSVDQADLRLTEMHLPLPPESWVRMSSLPVSYHLLTQVFPLWIKKINILGRFLTGGKITYLRTMLGI